MGWTNGASVCGKLGTTLEEADGFTEEITEGLNDGNCDGGPLRDTDGASVGELLGAIDGC